MSHKWHDIVLNPRLSQLMEWYRFWRPTPLVVKGGLWSKKFTQQLGSHRWHNSTATFLFDSDHQVGGSAPLKCSGDLVVYLIIAWHDLESWNGLASCFYIQPRFFEQEPQSCRWHPKSKTGHFFKLNLSLSLSEIGAFSICFCTTPCICFFLFSTLGQCAPTSPMSKIHTNYSCVESAVLACYLK